MHLFSQLLRASVTVLTSDYKKLRVRRTLFDCRGDHRRNIHQLCRSDRSGEEFGSGIRKYSVSRCGIWRVDGGTVDSHSETMKRVEFYDDRFVFDPIMSDGVRTALLKRIISSGRKVIGPIEKDG